MIVIFYYYPRARKGSHRRRRRRRGVSVYNAARERERERRGKNSREYEERGTNEARTGRSNLRGNCWARQTDSRSLTREYIYIHAAAYAECERRRRQIARWSQEMCSLVLLPLEPGILYIRDGIYWLAIFCRARGATFLQAPVREY